MTRSRFLAPSLVIARLTFMEVRREKVLSVLAGLACVATAISHLFSLLALGESRRVISDFGLGLATLLGVPLVIFVTTALRHREEQGGGIDLILSRPIGRGAFVVGRFLGMTLVLLLWAVFCGGLIAVSLIIGGEPVSAGVVPAVLLVWLKLSVLASVGLLLATVSSPMLGGFLILAGALVGHMVGDLERLVPMIPQAWLADAARWVLFLLPRLDLYGEALPMALGNAASQPFLLWAFAYAALYTTASLALASLRMERMELHART